MSLNPETLREEGDWERRERQARTGVIAEGIHVTCRPALFEDPGIIEQKHRAVCLTRPYQVCNVCPHSRFELVFSAESPDPYQLIQCPRWGNEGHRLTGYPPDYYVPVERAFCSARPFSFCSICPKEQTLIDIGADKVRSGWYGRWHRFTAVEDVKDG